MPSAFNRVREQADERLIHKNQDSRQGVPHEGEA
jgi:hypothetical protein